MEEEPYIVKLRMEIMHHLLNASYMWDGWNILYTWELRCDKSLEEMKSEILVRACHTLATMMMRNKKSPDNYVTTDYRNAIKEARRVTKVQVFKKSLQKDADRVHELRVNDTRYDWNKSRRLYYRANQLTPASKIRCANPDCKKIYRLEASEMELHHLLPRRLSPSLTYEVDNMKLICKACHKEIHKGWEAYWTLKRKLNLK